MIGATFTLNFDASAIGTRVAEAAATGVGRGAVVIQEEAQATVAVRTGDLRDSIQAQPPVVSGSVVSAEVTAGTDHAFFVEYGTGRRGAASAGAGDVSYNEDWPGMAAQPYMRPALDTRRQDVFDAIAEEVAGALA